MTSRKQKQDEPERPMGGAEHDATAGANAGTAANLFESARATDAEEAGKLTSTTKGQNVSSAAHAFEQRCSQGGSAH